MLVLTRKVGERIQLGDNITVTLVKISGSVVRIGIDAPPEMVVMRQELAGGKKAPSIAVSVAAKEPTGV
ncbi:MAG TPA: carbon storage regulator [Pirellulaceae bacterium]|jgi:carbon storage regulator